MNATKTRATKSTKTIAATCELFGLPLEESTKIPAILYALGFREACGRCGGSGSYSFCQMHGSTCFGCGGKGEHAAPLTAAVLEAARVKVAAGELDALRVAARAKKQARREIGPLVEAAREIYSTIGAAYEAAYQANVRSWNRETCQHESPIPESLHRAQELNNAIFYGTQVKGGREPGITGILSDVKSGARRDYLEARAEVVELTALLAKLRLEWQLFTVEF